MCVLLIVYIRQKSLEQLLCKKNNNMINQGFNRAYRGALAIKHLTTTSNDKKSRNNKSIMNPLMTYEVKQKCSLNNKQLVLKSNGLNNSGYRRKTIKGSLWNNKLVVVGSNSGISNTLKKLLHPEKERNHTRNVGLMRTHTKNLTNLYRKSQNLDSTRRNRILSLLQPINTINQ